MEPAFAQTASAVLAAANSLLLIDAIHVYDRRMNRLAQINGVFPAGPPLPESQQIGRDDAISGVEQRLRAREVLLLMERASSYLPSPCEISAID